MNLSTIKILGIDVWRQTHETNALESWHTLSYTSQLPTLFIYRSDGILVRSLALATTEKTIPDFWGDKVLGRYICPPEIIGEYAYWLALIEMKTECFTGVLASHEGRPSSWSKMVSALLENTFPTPNGTRIRPHDPLSAYSYILYVEPDAPLFNPKTCAESDLREFTQKAFSLFRFSQEIACIPHFLKDFLLLPGIGFLHFEDELTAFATKPSINKDPSNHISLPKTILHLVEYLACIRIYLNLKSRLESLPFFKMDIADYISSIKSEDNPNHSYGKRFLEDRVTVGAERLSVAQLEHKLSNTLSFNYIAKAYELEDCMPVNGVSQHPLRYYLLDHIYHTLRNLQLGIKETQEILERREAALSDYLRDITVYSSTEANLLLQKSIRRLTFFIGVITLLSLLIALTPDEIKQMIHTIVRKIFGLTH